MSIAESIKASERVEKYMYSTEPIDRARYALAWIVRECGEDNYKYAMSGNSGHAAGTIRLCREMAERILMELGE